MHEAEEQGIGARLRAARGRLGFSREELAYHSGISWSGIAQVESGRRTHLRPATLSALATALDVSMDYLVAGGVGPPSMLEHQALFYETDSDFAAAGEAFVAGGIERSEPTLVVTSQAHIRSLRRRLGSGAADVQFAGASSWYRAPERALEGYRTFLHGAVQSGATWVRILGEPAWPGRSQEELRLMARYESLLNLVFSRVPATILCPYRIQQLDPATLDRARETHPHILADDVVVPCAEYVDAGTYLLRA